MTNIIKPDVDMATNETNNETANIFLVIFGPWGFPSLKRVMLNYRSVDGDKTRLLEQPTNILI
ncbi:hypothetical protein R50073_12470 [Maricurvus nonylphenolicus]